jgi:hypothetical protein
MDQANSVSSEAAVQAFAGFVERFDIDVPDDANSDDGKTFARARRVVQQALERGQLTLSEDGSSVFRPLDGDPITFQGPTGATRMAIAGADDPVGKAMLALSQLSGEKRQRFERMQQRDLRVCEALLGLMFS